MNYRPDVNVGTGGNSLPFTLIPRRLAAGETLTRIPTMFPIPNLEDGRMTVRSLAIRAGNDAPRNQFFGPRDPVILNPGQTVEHVGRVQVTHLEPNDGEEYYKTQPLIFADGQYRSLRYRRKTYAALDIHSPVYSVVPTALGSYGYWMSMMYDKQPVGGGQYRDQVTYKTMSTWVLDAMGDANIDAGDIFRAITRRSVPGGTHLIGQREASTRFDGPLEREIAISDASIENGLPDIYAATPSIGVDIDGENRLPAGTVDFIPADVAQESNVNPVWF